MQSPVEAYIAKTLGYFFRTTIPFVIYAIFGVMTGIKLASLPTLIPYKALNVLGNGMSIFGMIVLSQLIFDNERYRVFILKHVAEQIQLFICASGLAFSIYSSGFSQGPSARILKDFAPSYFFYFVLPSLGCFIVGVSGGEDGTVTWTDKTRMTVLGVYLTGAGWFLQFFAAISDLLS